MDVPTKVAYACNLLSMEGHTDTIYGHVSARVENAAQVWMQRAAKKRCQEPMPCLVASKRLYHRDIGRSVALVCQKRKARSQGQGAGQSSRPRPLSKP